LFQLLCPTAHRLPMHAHPAGDFRRVQALSQQFGRLAATLF
jgi:hypothetical protein